MKLKTLIIDDSPMQALITSNLVKSHPNLEFLGVCFNPKEGLERIRELKPDLLFLDIEMPQMNGFELLDQLDVPCQVVLNSTRPQFAMDAALYKFSDFLLKPMNMDLFNQVIEERIAEKVQTIPTIAAAWCRIDEVWPIAV